MKVEKNVKNKISKGKINYRKHERRDLTRAVRREARQYNSCIHNVSLFEVRFDCCACFDETEGKILRVSEGYGMNAFSVMR